MIKVLFLIHDLGRGGAEKVLVNLVNHMDHTKFCITVMSLFGGGVNEQFLDNKTRYKTIFKKTIPGNRHIMKLFSPKLLHRLFIRETYDIEVSFLEGPSARIVSGCNSPDTKLVSWIHVEQHSKEIASIGFRNYKESRRCYELFHRTVCVSEYVKDDFLSLYPELQNVEVLYNVNDTDKILSLKDDPIEEGIYNKNEIKLCGVGKLVPVKAFDKLVRLHKRLLDSGYPVHTYILGRGPEQGKLQKYVSQNNLEDTVTFLGYQTNPYKYISRCDIFVCTSSAEGFSTAATEALIVGTAVVTTRVSGMEEMLGIHNEYGIVTDNSEDSLFKALTKLLDSPDLLIQYKAAALTRGKMFSTEKTVAMVEHMLEDLV